MVFLCNTMGLVSQLESSPEIWILQMLSKDPNKNPILGEACSPEISIEELRGAKPEEETLRVYHTFATS